MRQQLLRQDFGIGDHAYLMFTQILVSAQNHDVEGRTTSICARITGRTAIRKVITPIFCKTPVIEGAWEPRPRDCHMTTTTFPTFRAMFMFIRGGALR